MSPKLRSIEDLRRELRKRETELAKLVARRAKVAAKLEKLDRQIALLGGEALGTVVNIHKGRAGKAVAAKPGRKRSGKPLLEYIKQVLVGVDDGMRVKNVMKAVTKAGYKSISKDFYTIVASALRDAKVFENLSRGVYKLKA